MEVLEGATNSLRAGIIQSVLIEATYGEYSNIHVPLDRIVEFLAPFGFALHGLYDFGFNKNGRLQFFNALFFRDEV